MALLQVTQQSIIFEAIGMNGPPKFLNDGFGLRAFLYDDEQLNQRMNIHKRPLARQWAIGEVRRSDHLKRGNDGLQLKSWLHIRFMDC
ncbi:hypothetical protein [Rhizobium yanglingense]